MLVQDWQIKSAKIHPKLGQSLFIVSKSSQGIVFLGIYQIVTISSGNHKFADSDCLFSFPSYVGEAVDKTVPKDAEIPEHRKIATTEEAWLRWVGYGVYNFRTQQYHNLGLSFYLFLSFLFAFKALT